MGTVFFLPGEGDGILLYILTYAHTYIPCHSISSIIKYSNLSCPKIQPSSCYFNFTKLMKPPSSRCKIVILYLPHLSRKSFSIYICIVQYVPIAQGAGGGKGPESHSFCFSSIPGEKWRWSGRRGRGFQPPFRCSPPRFFPCQIDSRKTPPH